MLKNQNNAELEKIAEVFLKKWGRYDGRSLLIEWVIESFGFTIFPVQGLAEIAEAYIPVKPRFIFVDEEQYLNGSSFRWRFTLTEELAHILIHRPIFEDKSIPEIIRIQEGFSDAEYQIIERNAKYLAGCLLMPMAEFKNRFSHFFTLQSQRTSNSLVVLKYVVRQLSMDFNVSCYSVSLRALHLGLIDQQQLDDLIESFGWNS